MNILAINPGHNASAALVKNGELVYFIEEERLSRHKYDGNPFAAMLEAMEERIDVLLLGGTSIEFPSLPWTGEDPYSALVRKKYPKVQVYNLGHEHHLGHAASAFYNSGFETAAAIVVDGAGSNHEVNYSEGYETESIYLCGYPSEFKPVLKKYAGNKDGANIKTENLELNDAVTITKAYEAVTYYLGFGFIEAGKTMGLSPYGKESKDIPQMLYGTRADKNVFAPMYPAGAFLIDTMYENLANPQNPNEWHEDESKLTDTAKNLAWRVQHDTQNAVASLVQEAIERTGQKNIVFSGGYGMNCVTNYFLTKKFPEINFWFDPICTDAGTPIGLAKKHWHKETQDTKVRPLKSLYLGKSRPISKDHGMHSTLASPENVAKLICENNIVTIYQGGSEVGPRALGNRSILFDPRVPDGKEIVNVVKKREWFRPFAATILHEHFEEWFETAGIEESPFMMYAMKIKDEYIDKVPAVSHVDGTCRVQTVKREQNPAYYDLIKEFYNLTGIPMLLNTSFNLAGEPLVETFDDAVKTIKNSKIKYLYLPESGQLLQDQKKT